MFILYICITLFVLILYTPSFVSVSFLLWLPAPACTSQFAAARNPKVEGSLVGEIYVGLHVSFRPFVQVVFWIIEKQDFVVSRLVHTSFGYFFSCSILSMELPWLLGAHVRLHSSCTYLLWVLLNLLYLTVAYNRFMCLPEFFFLFFFYLFCSCIFPFVT